MKLYDYFRSSASYRVRIALNIKGISYTTQEIHLINKGGEQHQPSYLKLNPQGLVPTLINDDEAILTQSLAIIEYLEETHPTPPLLPSTALSRAEIRALSLIIACDIHPLNNLSVLNRLKNQLHATEQAVNDWYHFWLKKGFDAFEAKLGALPRKKPVCFGEHFTLADICLIPQVYNAKRFNFPLKDYPLIQQINDYCLKDRAFLDASPE